jgi:hypothetical protein
VFSFLEKNSLKRPDSQWLEGIQISLTTEMTAVEKSISENISRRDRNFKMRA